MISNNNLKCYNKSKKILEGSDNMGYREELTEIQNELRKAMKVYLETEGGPFDDGPKSARIYNKKLRALKEKYNIKDISNTDSSEKNEKTMD